MSDDATKVYVRRFDGEDADRPSGIPVRFWAYIGGGLEYVGINLEPGDSITYHNGGPDEEGWYSRDETFEHYGDVIVNTSDTDGSDCDGQLSTHCVREARIDDLDTWLSDVPDALPTPTWKRVESSQRDYAAEAAGY